MKYLVFTRTWWKKDSSWPGGLRPSPGRKTKIAYAHTEEEARSIATKWNENNKPGKYSRKAEYTSDY